jgi:tetratricopeptide (TPR) repeat protein
MATEPKPMERRASGTAPSKITAMRSNSSGNRAYAYSQHGDWDRAIADYGKAIELDPKNAVAYYYDRSVAYGDRAAAYLAKGDKKRWFTDFRRGMEHGPPPE